MRKFFLAALLALAGAFALAPTARALTYNNGDLFLGVRASSGNGAGQDYLVNIGPASQFTSGSGTYTVPNLGNIATDLTAIFGSDWSTRSDVYWSISGGNLAADPENTLYATRAQPAGTRATAWLGNSPSAQGVVNSKFGTLASTYKLGTATANSTVGTIQNAADTNSYASFQPGGTTVNANGQSFAAFSPSIENSFAGGPANSLLGLFRILPTYGQYAQDLGTFSLNATGVLSFTPAPVNANILFTSGTFSVDEDGGRAYLTLTRTGNLANVVSAKVSTASGTGNSGAVDGTDFTGVQAATVNFAAYATQATVEVPIALRASIQGNRSFGATLANPSTGAVLATPSSATITIVESETLGGKLNFALNSYQKSENATGDATLTVSVTRTNGQTNAASVQVATTGGTATAGSDFTLASPLTLNWADGDTAAKTFDIIVKADSLSEPIETITLALQNATGAVLGTKTTATVSLFDGTPAAPGSVSFSSPTYAQAEGGTGNSVATIAVTRTAGTNAVTVQVAATGGTATAGDDFALPGAPVTLSWEAGEAGAKTFNITINSDGLVEGAETVTLALQNPTSGLTLGSPATATLTITDPQDSVVPKITLVAPKASAKVSGTTATISGVASDNLNVARVEVSLNGGAAQSVTPSGASVSFNYELEVSPKPGLNTVAVRAVDSAGNVSEAVTHSFSFTLVRPALAGKYNGLILAATTSAVDRNGLVALTVTPTGSFTGKVSLGGGTVALKGTFDAAGVAQFAPQKTTQELVVKVGKVTTSFGFLSLQLDTGAGLKVTGTLKDGSTNSSAVTATIPHADLAVYTAKKSPALPLRNVPVTLLDPTKEKGHYTAILQAVSAPNNNQPATAYPQGDGYGLLTISTAGVVKLVGKLADGSAVSYANSLSADNHLPVYLALYKNTGFLRGEVTFASTANSDAAASLLWVKKANAADKAYPAGWPAGINVDFAAAKYLPPGQGGNAGSVLGNGVPAATSLVINATEGGLPGTSSNTAKLTTTSKITVDAPRGGTALEKLTVVVAPTTGAVTGSFTHPVSSKKVTFAGAVYQKTGQASGFFLYAPTDGPTVSGSIGIEKAVNP